MNSPIGVTRRSLLRTLAFGAGVLALPAPAIARGAGAFRSVKMVNLHTDEWLSAAYWVDGAYIPEALEAISVIMRDWREDAVKPIAPATIDILANLHGLLGAEEPLGIVSGYRTPRTNAMLRRNSHGVARNSYHIRGMAVDLTMKSRSVRQISQAALSLDAGGVGVYSRSDFVHVDSGPVRSWGR